MDYTTYLLTHPPPNPSQPILVDAHAPHLHLNHHTYTTLIRHLSTSLHHLGIEPNQCIALLSHNSIYYYPLADAIVAAGGIFTGLPPSASKSELLRLLVAAEVEWLFVEEGMLEGVLGVVRGGDEDGGLKIKLKEENVLVFDAERVGADGMVDMASSASTRTSLTSLLRGTGTSYFDTRRSQDPGKTAFRLLSSGTTGAPKAVEISHAACVARASISIASGAGRDSDSGASRPASAAAIRVLHLIAQHHNSGHYTHMRAMVGAQTSYITSLPDNPTLDSVAGILDQIVQHEIMVVALPPRVLDMLVEVIQSGLRGKECLRSLKCVLVTGSSPRKEAMEMLKELTEGKTWIQVPYGTTETGSIAHLPFGESVAMGYVGRAAPGVEILILDPSTSAPLPSGETGEIAVRSDCLFSCYLNNPSATASAFLNVDGGAPFYLTGDRGYISPSTSQLAVSGRYKEIFKVRYEEVSPSECEDVLRGMEGVGDCAVVSVPARDTDADSGIGDCEVLAYVVRRLGTVREKVGARDVVEYMSARLSAHKVPTGGVVFCDVIPRNVMGKVVRGKLGEVEEKEGSMRYLEM